MTSISAQLRRLVIDRASNRCEYCRLAQSGQEATFHIDHVVPRAEGGFTELANLALACVSCSLRKGARTSAWDSQSFENATLFNPRTQNWDDHFRWVGLWLTGLTPTGRATIASLELNRPRIIEIREEESMRGRHPG